MSEEKKADLKACPFCNSTRIVKGERYFAMCVDCGATGPERVRENTAARIYNGDWNTRPREQELEGLLKKASANMNSHMLSVSACDGSCDVPDNHYILISQITAALKEGEG